jgi:choice-of-anchor C domain-containing protein
LAFRWLTISALAVLMVPLASIVSTAAPPNPLLNNGSFEDGNFTAGSSDHLTAGSTDITGWSIDSGDIDWIGSLWVASNGSRSIDLNGFSSGTISQPFTTVPGETYTVTFDMAGNPQGTSPCAQGVKTLEASAGGTSQTFSFDTTGKTNSNMGWTQKSFSFVANSTTTTLTFESLTGSACGPALDNVKVISLFFTDSLLSPPSPNLDIPFAKYGYSAQGLVRTQSDNNTDRPMVKTVLGTYLTTDFIYEVDVMRTTTSDMDISFVGFGQGTPNGAFYNEPTNAFVFRIHNSPGFYRIDAAVEASSGTGQPVPLLYENIASFGNGVNTRFRITRAGDTVTLSVPSQNASRSFSLSQWQAQLGLNNSNAYLFFGNTLTGTVFSNVTVTENQPPDAICKNVTTNTAPGTCSANASVDNGSSDPDGDPITLSQSPAGPYGKGTTNVTLTVTDDKGASDFCTATVTVVDAEPPTITCPAPQVVECTGAGSAVASFSATATDNCGFASTSCPASGSSFPLGTTPVSCSASDDSNNSSSCSSSVTVVDTTAPTVSCVESVNPSGKNVPKASNTNQDGFYKVSASDICTTPVIKIGGFTLANGETIKITQTPGKSGVSYVNTMGPAAIRHFQVGPGDAVITATDGSGNSSSVTCLVPPPPK